jgi:hypothetical protein
MFVIIEFPGSENWEFPVIKLSITFDEKEMTRTSTHTANQ